MEAKRIKLEENPDPKGCHHFVERKKRWCRMSVAKGHTYCGEHSGDKAINESASANPESGAVVPRVPCPLDPKHTVFADRLQKHMKICNAREQAKPEYIKKDINAGDGDDEEKAEEKDSKLSEQSVDYLIGLVGKVRAFYDSIKPSFDPREETVYHPDLEKELDNSSYGPDTLKHLRQTSALLGSMKRLQLLLGKTCYIEFGAGKGQVSYFLANALKDLPETAVALIDRASMRHKMDNKCEDRDSVQRVRADIADLDLKALPQVQGKENVIGVSKHLCGAATDLAIRCMINGSRDDQSQGLLIAVCCHHRCSWRAFVGKSMFQKHDLSPRDFLFVIKMVSWAVCGGGMSRERRKLVEEQADAGIVPEDGGSKLPWTKEEQEEIGYMCKRIIDYSRLQYLKDVGYATDTFYYINKAVTLENLCIFAKKEVEKMK